MLKLVQVKRILHKKNNGSTLITVIVAIAFVTILVSIILGTTVVNIRMKGIDKLTKDRFYYAEKALNDIYTGVGQIMAKNAGDQYTIAFNKVGLVEGTNNYNLAKTAENAFREGFLKKAHDDLNTVTAAQLNKYITSRGTVESVGHPVYQKKNGSSASDEKSAERVVLKDVCISDTDTSGNRAVITTDIVINLPTVDFLGTNADVSDYGLIANEGLYILGDGTEANKTVIKGNVYAGVHKTEITDDSDGFKDDDFKERTDRYSRPDLFGGINIKGAHVDFSGNYIVSKGDITLAGSSPRLKVYTPSKVEGSTNLANLWYTTLRTVSGATLPEPAKPFVPSATNTTIDIDANIFALNDLTLNANNSCVRINGNYYGYNDKTISPDYVLGLKTDILDSTKKREDAESSAIIINGTDTYLSMENIKNFVLMGKAYIDFTSDTQTDVDAISVDKQVVPTAESVALATNQQLYLVPPDFLENPNPTTDAGGFSISVSESDLKSWFGYPYLNPVTDWKDIGEIYTVKLDDEDSTDVYYYYLKFNDKTWVRGEDGKYTESSEPLGTGGSVSSKARFFQEIMTARKAYEDAYAANNEGYTLINDYIAFKESSKTQPSAYRLWERINLSLTNKDYFDLRECVIGDGSSNAHYYAKNAVVNYKRDGSDISSSVLDNTDGMFRYASYPQNLFYRYVFLCTRLDGKENELIDHDWSSDAGVDLTGLMNDWKIEYTNAAPPLCHFVDVASIGSMGSITDAETAGLKRGAYGVVVVTNSDLVINGSFTGLTGTTFKGVAIVDGDIVVDEGYDVDGLLMATGTITLKGKNKINYNKGLVQARIEKEMNLVRNSSETGEAAYKNYYLIKYLADDSSGSPKRIYDVVPGSKIRQDRIEADYNDFMHYENWQKGEK